MSVDEFRQLYPEAQFIEQTAARYCYGEEVNIGSLSRLDAIVRRGEATVHITFDYKFFGRRISQIKNVEVIEFDPSRFTSLRDRLVRLYGPYTGMKYPHKMDPAGLIVGFEWEQRGVAYLSITIHRDHASESGPIRQTTLLTRSLPDMEDQRKAAASLLIMTCMTKPIEQTSTDDLVAWIGAAEPDSTGMENALL
jgi:hypothetical protein